MTSPETHRLFVYGTLKRGGSNHRWLSDQVCLGEARTVAGYRLYHLGEYPGMVADPTDSAGVSGEVWQVSPEALARLDAFEGVPEGLYAREPVSLLGPWADQRVDSYLYLRSVAGRQDLGGNWPPTSL